MIFIYFHCFFHRKSLLLHRFSSIFIGFHWFSSIFHRFSLILEGAVTPGVTLTREGLGEARGAVRDPLQEPIPEQIPVLGAKCKKKHTNSMVFAVFGAKMQECLQFFQNNDDVHSPNSNLLAVQLGSFSPRFPYARTNIWGSLRAESPNKNHDLTDTEIWRLLANLSDVPNFRSDPTFPRTSQG